MVLLIRPPNLFGQGPIFVRPIRSAIRHFCNAFRMEDMDYLGEGSDLPWYVTYLTNFFGSFLTWVRIHPSDGAIFFIP